MEWRPVLADFPVGKVWDSGYAHGSRIQQNFCQTIKSNGIRVGISRAGVISGDTILKPIAEYLSGGGEVGLRAGHGCAASVIRIAAGLGMV